jgi:ribosome biogenesis GTPase
VVGDRVGIVGDLSGESGSLARIVRVEERRSTLRRTADDDDPYERIIVANADQLAIVTALADPEPRPRLIDRCLVAAYDAGLEPLLVLTKADLASPDDLLTMYGALGVEYVVTKSESNWDLDPIRARLAGKITVFVGHSGVGKTTLVNELVPDHQRAVGHVNEVTGRGRHTTTSALTLRLPVFERGEGQGWVVDTPGVRSFGLNHVDLSRVINAFPDLAAGTEDCPRACSHDEPDCGLDAWVAAGHADPARLYSLRRLLKTRERDEGD